MFEDSLVRCIKCKAVVQSVDATIDVLLVGQEGPENRIDISHFRRSAEEELLSIHMFSPVVPLAHQ
ncbi:hypothetical protein D9757_010761 [Collybiopsis confluens]|uniref:Uncharacterized protein n=1 Tax=Collybiopsis confluens TaxID=2823264 RepID=A0A8H5H8P1_9AGAR|nr:hypothetical protein D9757_010761 [Collybiopsis confluens]